ncbi:hypothetical protein B0H10DRAFT_2062727 [Mycena sp. CBHHK59/15]|nr:hypothetical protein B0H10DRAFT_2062727 [Mycena sp. CBHHK59/15]
MLAPPQGRPSSSDMSGGFSYAPSIRGASTSSTYNNSQSYYPLSSQTSFVPPSFETFSSSRSQPHTRNLPTPYSDYPVQSSSRSQPHRNPSGDPFGALMDAEDPARQTHGIPPQGAGYTGIDWPVHGGGGGGSTMRRMWLHIIRDTTDSLHEHRAATEFTGKCEHVARPLVGLPGGRTGRRAGGEPDTGRGATGESRTGN